MGWATRPPGPSFDSGWVCFKSPRGGVVRPRKGPLGAWKWKGLKSLMLWRGLNETLEPDSRGRGSHEATKPRSHEVTKAPFDRAQGRLRDEGTEARRVAVGISKIVCVSRGRALRHAGPVRAGWRMGW